MVFHHLTTNLGNMFLKFLERPDFFFTRIFGEMNPIFNESVFLLPNGDSSS